MIINLTIFQMLLAFFLPLLVIYLIYLSKLEMEKEIFKSILTMIVQLMLIGIILTIIFSHIQSSIGSLYIFIMLFFAIRKLKSRINNTISKQMYLNAIKALCIGSIFMLIYFVIIIIRPNPFLDPQYMIPLYGMILGNTLTALILVINSLTYELETEQAYINTLLDIGVAPRAALTKIFSSSLKVAISPTLTSMSAMGLVSLPGMMTGQILSGTAPFIAVKYQIAIMLIILSSTAFSTIIFLFLTQKALINEYNQYVGL